MIMEQNVKRESALLNYGLHKPLNKRQEEITPWSFYQQQEVKTIIPIPIVKNSSPKQKPQKRSKSSKDDYQKVKSIEAKRKSNKQSQTSTADQAKQNQLAQMNDLKKEISDIVRERLLLKVIAKYFDISEKITGEDSKRLSPSNKSVLPEINLNASLEKQTPSKQIYRSSQQNAFTDVQLQIHSIPPELKLRLAKMRRNSRMRILSKRDLIQGEYAEFNFKKSIEVSGERKPVSFK